MNLYSCTVFTVKSDRTKGDERMFIMSRWWFRAWVWLQQQFLGISLQYPHEVRVRLGHMLFQETHIYYLCSCWVTCGIFWEYPVQGSTDYQPNPKSDLTFSIFQLICLKILSFQIKAFFVLYAHIGHNHDYKPPPKKCTRVSSGPLSHPQRYWIAWNADDESSTTNHPFCSLFLCPSHSAVGLVEMRTTCRRNPTEYTFSGFVRNTGMKQHLHSLSQWEER